MNMKQLKQLHRNANLKRRPAGMVKKGEAKFERVKNYTPFRQWVRSIAAQFELAGLPPKAREIIATTPAPF